MTREEIQNAITCCNPYDEDCVNCPFNKYPRGRCFEVLAKTAFTTLLEDRERLQRQVKEYQDKIGQGTLIDKEELFIIEDEAWGKYKFLICSHHIEQMIEEFCSTREEAENRLKELQERQ